MPPEGRSGWSVFADQWSDDDAAIKRMREALRAAETAPGRPEPIEAEPSSCEPDPALPEPSKQARVSQLVARIRAGDLSAVDALRRLIE